MQNIPVTFKGPVSMKNLLIFLCIFTASCQAEHTSDQGEPAVENNAASPVVNAAVEPDAVSPAASAALMITWEGNTHELHNINWAKSNVTFGKEEINVYLMEDNKPVEMNLRLTDIGILEKGSVVYELPADNKDNILIDLNFFNSSRKSIAVQQRILFTEGTINIKEITRNSLKMEFKGSGHPLMAKERIPLEGTVNITF